MAHVTTNTKAAAHDPRNRRSPVHYHRHLADKSRPATYAAQVCAAVRVRRRQDVGEKNMSRHIVSFSTGLSSALTAERVLKQHPDAYIVFMDTQIEDDDNYRFMQDCSSRWINRYQPQFVTLSDGRNPFQVFEDVRIIPNTRIAPCTFKLKIELFAKFVEPGDTIYIGYDYSEVDRCEATTRNWEARGCKVEYPLLWKPIEHRKYADIVRQDWGILPPRMYGMGYTHANCGGRCVKQGHGDWIRTLVNFPARYSEAEQWELMMQERLGTDYTISKDRTGGETKPITLRELRQRYEAKQANTFDLFLLDTQSACVKCGVGDFTESEE